MLLARRPNFVDVAHVTKKAEYSWSASYYTRPRVQTINNLDGERDKASPYPNDILETKVT